MKLLSSKLIHPAAALCAVLLLAACADNDVADRQPVLQNIVQYDGIAEGRTLFTYYAPGSGTPEVLTARGEYIFGDIEEGEALLLTYTADATATGYIYVNSGRKINNLVLLQSEPEGLEGWDSEGVYLLSAWRAGNRLNMRLNLTYDSAPRRFAIIVDKTTIDEEYPMAYLYHRRGTGTPNFAREYYVSCTLEALFSRDTVKGLRLRLLDTNTASGTPQVRTLSFAR